jgi:hypothetical protein
VRTKKEEKKTAMEIGYLRRTANSQEWTQYEMMK